MDIEALIQRVKIYCPYCDPEFFYQAHSLAQKAYSNKSFYGRPQIAHGLATAGVLAELQMDPATLAAAILYGLEELTGNLEEIILRDLGSETLKLLEGIIRLNMISWTGLGEEKSENLRRMFLSMVDDIRVVLIKLADRVQIMRNLSHLSPLESKKIAREAKDIFASLANRLGIASLKSELEDLAFQYLEPENFLNISRRLASYKENRSQQIQSLAEILSKELKKNKIKFNIVTRTKHLYSIYRKMVEKGRSFNEIYDVQGIRIIVNTISDCYAALDIIHSMWPPIPGEFDDYIAKPKPNLYRSLHTAVTGPEGRPVEIQIRTETMNKSAELGIAAHWRYKESAGLDGLMEAKIAGLRGLIEWQEELSKSSDSKTRKRSSLLSDRIYVFTPNGDIIDLPAGSTPIDFAYSVHQEIGNRCSGAKVNGCLVPLGHKLQSGDRVEIITSKNKNPSLDWLNPRMGYVVSARAKQKIRQWFRKQEKEENIARGRESLEKELKRAGLSKKNFEILTQTAKLKDTNELFEAAGRGDLNIQKIVSAIIETDKKPASSSYPDTIHPETQNKISCFSDSGNILVMGTPDLLLRLAGCCRPLPGDKIIGFITRGRGVTIHKAECPHVSNPPDKQRLIDACWGSGVHSYPTTLKIIGGESKRLLKNVMEIFEYEGAVVVSADILPQKKDLPTQLVTVIEIKGKDHLKRILSRIRSLPDIMAAERYQG